MTGEEFLRTVQAGEEGKKLSAEEIRTLLTISDAEELKTLFAAADRVREKGVGDEVHLRAIIEFSNICSQNCLYCGLRRDNQAIDRYRMPPSEIMKTAEKAQSQGLGTVVLQSGEDPWFTRDRISELVRAIKDKTGLAITLSLGERAYGDYQAWKKAGADRYLLKQETSAPALFRRLRPGRTIAARLQALRWLRELGYEVGSGNMVGLPGQTDEDLAADIRLFRKLDFDMIGIGPFIAHPQTPLAAAANGELEKALKVLAVTRIITKNTNLPATTAVSVCEREGQQKALMAGANVIMPNLTPLVYRRCYQIYPGKERFVLEIEEIKNMILAMGRRIGPGTGCRMRSRAT